MSGEWINISATGIDVRAWRAAPQDARRGGVVVLQEIFGVNENIREICNDFAEHGYEAIAPALFERVTALAKNGLKVHLCEITFQRLKLDKAKVKDAPFISFVPSGVATVAALQSKGFAYLKVG